MSGDEQFVLVLSILFGPVLLLIWAYRLSVVATTLGVTSQLHVVLGALAVSLAIIFIVLRTMASPDVRDAPQYLVLYVALGLAWLRLAELLFVFVGVGVRDDAIERRNPAASIATAGGLVGVTGCYAGGNIGAGPGWWVVVVCAALSTTCLFGLWLALGWLSSANESVTIERDLSAGIRLSGWLVACGLVLGRAVAGDWVSGPDTMVDLFRFGWPAVVLLCAATAVERLRRPTVADPHPDVIMAGAAPALLYLGIAIVDLVLLGRPS